MRNQILTLIFVGYCVVLIASKRISLHGYQSKSLHSYFGDDEDGSFDFGQLTNPFKKSSWKDDFPQPNKYSFEDVPKDTNDEGQEDTDSQIKPGSNNNEGASQSSKEEEKADKTSTTTETKTETDNSQKKSYDYVPKKSEPELTEEYIPMGGEMKTTTVTEKSSEKSDSLAATSAVETKTSTAKTDDTVAPAPKVEAAPPGSSNASTDTSTSSTKTTTTTTTNKTSAVEVKAVPKE